MRIRDAGIVIGEGKPGKRNLISDVNGVKAGHCTVDEGNVHTGVTVVMPCENVFTEKPLAAAHVINGFGKTAGLMQIEELGCLESPIALTNTLSVSAALEGLVKYTVSANPDVKTFNPTAGETNDSSISDITALAVNSGHVLEALHKCSDEFELGSVGAGRGTVCFGFKGGIGSASRVMQIGNEEYTIGVLVQSNFGLMKDLVVSGDPLGQRAAQKLQSESVNERGSVMIIVGTDLPLEYRQLKRLLKRAETGLIHLGSRLGHGSGDVVIGFTTANSCGGSEPLREFRVMREDLLNLPFRMIAEAVEEAVLDSMYCSEGMTALNGKYIPGLKEFL